MHRIYKLTFPSGKFYIGRTEQRVSVRIAQHRYDALKRKFDRTIHRAIRKYGSHSFSVEILNETLTLVEAVMMESHYIQEYDSVKKGYNQTYRTEGHGDVWKDRKNEASYTEFVKKMSKISQGKNNPMYGKTHSPEARQKQKLKAKGRFSLPWFISKYGLNEGTQKYNDRCQWLRERQINRGADGKFSV